MATQEQMQQFCDTSSDDESTDDDESTEELVPVERKPPLLKLKLRLPKKEDEDDDKKEEDDNKMQLSSTSSDDDDDDDDEPLARLVGKPEAAKSSSSVGAEVETEPEVVNATVVDEDDEDDEEDATDVVAEPVLMTSSQQQRSSSLSNSKKRQSVRPIKMPAIASPGLLLANGTTTAAQFDYHMKASGYSLEARTDNPHRGSSTKREVGDMFDSDVTLMNNFPKLVPPELISDDTPEAVGSKLMRMLKKGLKEPKNGNKRKRRFDDMIPISLKIDYPAEFIREQQEFVKKVKTREDAIKEAQEAELEYKTPTTIPLIPTPPPPPKLAENQQGLDIKDDKQHPLYPPKNAAFVKHLDPNCFHSSEGRYLGLLSNSLSDPHFTGAHAIGVQNLSVTAGTGLATTQTGSTSAGSASLASTVYGDRNTTSKGETKIADDTSGTTIKKELHTKSKLGIKKKKSVALPAPASSGTAADLKKIMERKTSETEEMRRCIISAGVYASRTYRHGQSFVGPDGNTYPDVSKTFASYAGIKPCIRCKNNKQGAYHCRLRRRHKEADHDGGDSNAVLAPLFEDPIETLIIKKIPENS
mmetsp:Transcript_19148/g.29165  ORF Transcript_19148/g.29165 Transcript_19148/m.29165 type:complete len:585 (+) Transcript_19148:53-1807(+)|eukprot:CAMPEP_0194209150 /NCGR_PEP_ID=MMETSP0156-20130528/7376_1 /TAXON_ID=33649 /ORGANISM="Thalassionema nitzschioides, Strain L26-B" /LENGTH=584 /DNA_ID=CAMNT_0038936263 /DNA_START=34 /DNA_END=1788 /DNA_ORIENTATION=-